MLSLLLVAPLLAPSATLSVLTPVDAQCQQRWSQGALHVLHRRVGFRCRRAGECSRIFAGDLEAEPIRLFVEGCEAPLRGRFVETRRSCGGPTLKRFIGEIPPGRSLVVRAQGTMHGWFKSPGGRQAFQCPGGPRMTADQVRPPPHQRARRSPASPRSIARAGRAPRVFRP